MKNIVKSKLFKNYISFFLSILSIEILFRILSSMPLVNWAMVRIFLGCHSLALVLALLLQPLKEKAGKIVSSLLFFFITIYAMLQLGFENYLGTYISLGASSQLGAVSDYIKEFFSSFRLTFYTLLVPYLLYVIYKYVGEKHCFKAYYQEKDSFFEKRNRKKNVGIGIFVVLLSSFLYKGTLSVEFMQNALQLESTKTLFKNPSNTNISVNQFGVTTFGLLDIKTTLIQPKEEDISYFQKTEEEKEITDLTRHIDDTDWKELDNNTTDKNYKLLNSYFMSQEITDKNEYTGAFKDKNVIVIMMESVNEIFIHPEYYPTFYKLYTEGWSFKNSYSPRNSCATGNNEMSGMTSLFTIYRKCTANDYRDNTYNQSIFNLFNKAGYQTSSFHNYTEHYYYRNTIHKNMGSGMYYGVEDLQIPYSNAYKEWPSDILLMEEAIKRIDTTKPFMTWLTTVTSHQPYGVSSEFGDKHLDLFKNTEYPIELKRYMSKLKELDLALERLLELLEEKEILKDTVLVLFGDHYPYGLDNKDLNLVLPYNVDERNNVDKTPFVIYNSEATKKEFDVYTSYINILPTLLNLFDLEYDPRLYMGEDILAPDYKNSYKNRVILADGSWETTIGRYDATNGIMTYYGKEDYTEEEVISYNKEINDKIKMSTLAITTNYFEYLQNGLSTYKTSLPTGNLPS